MAQMAAQIQGFLAAGRAADGVPVAAAQVTLATEVFGAAAAETGAALSDRAEIARVTARLQESAADFARAEALLAQRPADDPGLATHRYRYAELLRMMGKPAAALALYRQVASVYARLYGADHIAVATCQNAQAEMLRTLGRPREPRIWHIASHGWFLPAPPPSPPASALTMGQGEPPPLRIEDPLLRAGLALAGCNVRRNGQDDGALTATEAASLDLFGTRLVVLSACNTGVGDTAGGFGVSGLRRAFAVAGAETLLMSLWSVDDSATRPLMTAFHTQTQAGLGRSEALRQAQLQMLAQPRTRHPFFWSAFQVAGDWRPL